MAAQSNDDVRSIMVETARLQVASLKAAITFWRGWVERASEFAESTSADLVRVADLSRTDGEAIGRLSDSAKTFVRRLSELPELAADAFKHELKAQGPAPRGARRRAARAKA
jgi:hypothetical protein